MTLECSICRFTTDSPLGMASHARKHRNAFERATGRRAETYAEVRAFFQGDGELATLDDFEHDTECSAATVTDLDETHG